MNRAIELENVSKQFAGSSQASLHATSLTIEAGQFVTILGASGSGKTTLLRLINRLIEPSSGIIRIEGQDTAGIPATQLRRNIGYVIQQAGLFPHMSVAQNIAVVPEILGWPRSRIDARINELLTLVELPPESFRQRYPRQLSGGQQQRVGLARALAGNPGIMLMDEPFGALDAITRASLQDAFRAIQRQLGKTVVFVTHDVQEALKLGDRVMVMEAGRIVQFDTPEQLLRQPANDFVRSLLSMDAARQPLAYWPLRPWMSAMPETVDSRVPRIRDDQLLEEALPKLLDSPLDYIAVENERRELVGVITLDALKAARRQWRSGGGND